MPPGSERSLEALVHEVYSADPIGSAIFLLAAPRTGSTLLYQAIAKALGLPYIANAVNDQVPDSVAAGVVALWPATERWNAHQPFSSSYGKTAQPLAPSEGSAVMQRWFGGGHPSELVSSDFLPGMAREFSSSLRAIYGALGRPLVVKNAWNCFRVRAIHEALPHSRFIWIRRDLLDAATSDLLARQATKGSLHRWNSATPRNLFELESLPPAGQVVENQVEFNRALSEALSAVPASHRHVLWYEDFCREPNSTVAEIATSLSLTSSPPESELPSTFQRQRLNRHDELTLTVEHYVEEHAGRLQAHRYMEMAASNDTSREVSG